MPAMNEKAPKTSETARPTVVDAFVLENFRPLADRAGV
ncbi:MAG: hypothetical protein KatS3mg123_1316 [Burkholderiales bacterium]|nr:MAG: hypothetical protein KatS3mg123_1316 [Burkholderiales bacterium]